MSLNSFTTLFWRNEIWKKESEEKETAIQSLKEEAKAKEGQIEDIKNQLSSTMEELAKLQESEADRISAENFNNRMSVLDDIYQLEDEDRILLASELKELGSEEKDFSAYKAKLSLAWKVKSKTFIEEQEKVFQERVAEEVSKRINSLEDENSTETHEEVVEAAMENVEKEEEVVLNNNGESSQEELTLREKFMKSFNKENVSIQY